MAVEYFARRFAVVARQAKTLPICAIPKQRHIALVTRDVVNRFCRLNTAKLGAVNAERMFP